MMSSYIIAVIIVNCIVVKQLNINASNWENSMGSIKLNQNNSMISSFQSSSILSKPLNLVGSFTKWINLKPNEIVAKLCGMNTGQLCAHYGYESENFTVTTTDGFILTIFRCSRTITKMQPVLLVHGLLDSSDTWVMNPGNESLAYNYVERGYDVYMMNCRGNRYSQRHTTLHPYQSEFWNFSYQEMAHYDVPETIDVIRKRTGAATIQYVGHSQGSAVLLGLLATAPQYNQIISHAGLIAPFLFKNDVGFPMNFIYKAFYYLSSGKYWQFLPHSMVQNMISETICKVFNGKLCNFLLNFILGPSADGQLSGEMIPVYFCHFPAGASSKQFWHFGQESHCNYFGETIEVRVRSQTCQHPLPSFNLNAITTALSLFYSPTDPHTHPVDIETLQKSLTHANLTTHKIYEYNHMEFTWGKNAATDVYDALIARAEQFH